MTVSSAQPTFPFGQSVTVVTRVMTQDRDGNDVPGNNVSTVYNHIPLWFGSTSELVQGQDIVDTTLHILLPPQVVPAAIDAVIFNGATYEVDGDPFQLVSPFTTFASGVEVRLRKVAG